MINSGTPSVLRESGAGYRPMPMVRYYQGRKIEVECSIRRVPFSGARFRVVETWIPRSDGWYCYQAYIRNL